MKRSTPTFKVEPRVISFKGFDSLRGKLRDDFLTLLKEETDKGVEIYRANMCKEMEALQLSQESEYVSKMAAVQKEREDLEVERMGMLRQLQDEIDCLDSHRTSMVKQQRDKDHVQIQRAAMLETSYDEERAAICEKHREEMKMMKQELRKLGLCVVICYSHCSVGPP